MVRQIAWGRPPAEFTFVTPLADLERVFDVHSESNKAPYVDSYWVLGQASLELFVLELGVLDEVVFCL